jgi:hypothetical protein
VTGRRPSRVVLGVLLGGALATLSACSIPSRPAWLQHHSAPSASAPAGNAAPAPAALLTVSHPWHAGMRQLGIQVYWTGDNADSDAVIRAKASRIVNYAISLGSNSIALTFPFYTYGITSDAVFRDKTATPSPARISIFLAVAAASHLRVTLRPILNEDALIAQDPIAWRGSIRPSDVAAWFQSYRRLLTPYAEAAQAGNAATFVIGTELESLEQASEWPAVIDSIKSVYSGQLLYAENFDEFEKHDSELPLATFGVDAYPRFKLPDSASVGSLTSAWDGWLSSHRKSVLHKVILEEVGIDAVAGSYPDPGAWITTTHAPIDLAVQTKWYQAVCRAIQDKDLAGVYWWEIPFDANPATPRLWQSDRLTFLGRPAQDVIKTCFASLTDGTAAP